MMLFPLEQRLTLLHLRQPVPLLGLAWVALDDWRRQRGLVVRCLQIVQSVKEGRPMPETRT